MVGGVGEVLGFEAEAAAVRVGDAAFAGDRAVEEIAALDRFPYGIAEIVETDGVKIKA